MNTFISIPVSTHEGAENDSNRDPLFAETSQCSSPFYGRSFEEYTYSLSLTPALLRGKRVLDVGAGPSSFVAEACELGCDAIAVDTLYGRKVEALSQYVAIDYAAEHLRMRAAPHRYTSDTGLYGSIQEAAVRHRAAASRFLDNYAAYFPHGRYVGAALPELPFEDMSFDLVICANLLFGDRPAYSREFHIHALKELVRVSKFQVRVFPAPGAQKQYLPIIEEALKEASIRVTYGSRAGAEGLGSDAMLLLERDL